MKILVINGHPDKESFCHYLYDNYLENSNKKNEIKSIDLSDINFDPVLRFGYNKRMQSDSFIEESQKLIQWADRFIFIYPIWWSGMPSLLKGWIERVFTPKIAYNHSKHGFIKLLKKKKATIITTCGAPALFYKLFSGIISVKNSYGIACLKNTTLSMCGIKTNRILCFGFMNNKNKFEKNKNKYIKKVIKEANRYK